MFNLAERWGLRADGTNPCRHVERFPERPRERFLSDDELARLGTVLKGAEEGGLASAEAVAAIRLLLLTGCRVSEVLRLQWEDIAETRAYRAVTAIASVHSSRLKIHQNVSCELGEVVEVAVQDLVHPADIDVEVAVHEDVAEAGHRTEADREFHRQYAEFRESVDRGRIVGCVSACRRRQVRRDVERVLGAELEPALDQPALVRVRRELRKGAPDVVAEPSE